MKKILLLLVAFLGISYAANAQSCTISGLNDGSTIQVTNHWLEGDKVCVNLSNDSDHTCANVTVVVEVTYKNGGNTKTETFQNIGKSCPQSDAKVEVKINTVWSGNNNYKLQKYEVKSVSGSKCNQLKIQQ